MSESAATGLPSSPVSVKSRSGRWPLTSVNCHGSPCCEHPAPPSATHRPIPSAVRRRRRQACGARERKWSTSAFGNKGSVDDSIQDGTQTARRDGSNRMSRDVIPWRAPLRLYRNLLRVVVPWAFEAESESICRSALKGGCSGIVRNLHSVPSTGDPNRPPRWAKTYFLEKTTDAR
ncbi:hypothetical protein PSAB6_90031 [Paraburkholderia sabiae]|nr:hypothetical protein PSAB6_90031 [Paraburkholderia sabiae]